MKKTIRIDRCQVCRRNVDVTEYKQQFLCPEHRKIIEGKDRLDEGKPSLSVSFGDLISAKKGRIS